MLREVSVHVLERAQYNMNLNRDFLWCTGCRKLRSGDMFSFSCFEFLVVSCLFLFLCLIQVGFSMLFRFTGTVFGNDSLGSCWSYIRVSLISVGISTICQHRGTGDRLQDVLRVLQKSGVSGFSGSGSRNTVRGKGSVDINTQTYIFVIQQGWVGV